MSATREKEFLEAARQGDTNKILSLLKDGTNVNCRDDTFCMTALMWAARNGHKDTVRVLLEHKVDMGAKDRLYGKNALMLAARCGHKDTVRVLLEHKADIEAKSKNGKTALQHASGATKEVLEAAVAAKKEAAGAAITGLGDLLASLGLKDQAPAAAEWFQALDFELAERPRPQGRSRREAGEIYEVAYRQGHGARQNHHRCRNGKYRGR